MNDPIAKFNQWWQLAIADSPLQQKSAVCVSTIDSAGFPQARFVDLKAASEQGFVFCSYLDSNKGQEISANDKVAITAWWDHIGYQIRIVGIAKQLEQGQALEYWHSRNRGAQLTTTAFEQSKPLDHEQQLEQKFTAIEQRLAGSEVPMPTDWGGYIVEPISIEFLTFAETRLHLRELYQISDKGWQKSLLQP